MKKKISVVFILLSFMMIIAFYVKPIDAYALSNTEDVNLISQSQAGCLVDAYSGTVVYSKNGEQRLPIASMCKIMTTLLSFEAVDDGFMSLDDIICVSENASSMGGSQVFLEANANYKVADLLKSVIVASANDASVALAEHIAGSESQFVEKMNDKAEELGMKNTLFSNCTGLPKPTQYSCAVDVAKMFAELLNHKDYYKFSSIWMDEISHPEGRVTGISNTNKLVRFYSGCDAGKTGYTSEAGHCVTATAARQGLRLISVIIKAPDSKTRFKEASDMLNYGFANYVNKMVVDDKKPLNETVTVVGGKTDFINVAPKIPVFLFCKKNQKRAVEVVFESVGSVKAPVNVGDVVGKIHVYDESGIEINSVDVVSTENVEKAGYFDSLKKVSDNWSLVN